MSREPILRAGDGGDAVRELQERLDAIGYDLAADADFDARTEAAVRAFQEDRCLRADGICGPQTWAALVEAGYHLGDRNLYYRRTMLRGDDVTELQRRLNALGFDAGREDGILGPDTESAIRQFQRNTGLFPDGVFGPETRKTLDQVDGLAGGSVATVREREQLRRGPHQLTGKKIYLAADPTLAMLASAVLKGLDKGGAWVVPDTSGSSDSVLATEANRFGADVFVALRLGDGPCRVAYFSTTAFRSEAGFLLAQHLDAELGVVLGATGGTIGRMYPALRETQMTAVICELVSNDDGDALAELVARNHDVAAAIVRGIREGVERPLDPPA